MYRLVSAGLQPTLEDLLFFAVFIVVAALIFVSATRESRNRRRQLEEANKKIEACQQALRGLETRAGIAEAVKNALEEPPYTIGDMMDIMAAEPDSDEREEREDAAIANHRRRTDRHIRELYFSVRDPKLRKALIAKEREAERLDVRYFELRLYAARDKLVAAERPRWGEEWLMPAAFGIGLISIGYALYGMVGALGGLLAGYFLGRYAERDTIHRRKSDIAEAKQEVKESEESWNDRRNKPRLFSGWEEQTGEPEDDPESHLRAV